MSFWEWTKQSHEEASGGGPGLAVKLLDARREDLGGE